MHSRDCEGRRSNGRAVAVLLAVSFALAGCRTTFVLSPSEAARLDDGTMVTTDGEVARVPSSFRATLKPVKRDSHRLGVSPGPRRCREAELVPDRLISVAETNGWSFDALRFAEPSLMRERSPWFVVTTDDDRCVLVTMDHVHEVELVDQGARNGLIVAIVLPAVAVAVAAIVGVAVVADTLSSGD